MTWPANWWCKFQKKLRSNLPNCILSKERDNWNQQSGKGKWSFVFFELVQSFYAYSINIFYFYGWKHECIIKPTTLKKVIAQEYKQKIELPPPIPYRPHVLVGSSFFFFLQFCTWLVHLNSKITKKIIAYLDYDLSSSFVQSKFASCSND